MQEGRQKAEEGKETKRGGKESINTSSINFYLRLWLALRSQLIAEAGASCNEFILLAVTTKFIIIIVTAVIVVT